MDECMHGQTDKVVCILKDWKINYYKEHTEFLEILHTYEMSD